jgi:hypothetical protein
MVGLLTLHTKQEEASHGTTVVLVVSLIVVNGKDPLGLTSRTMQTPETRLLGSKPRYSSLRQNQDVFPSNRFFLIGI